ncbi:hypothetical protein T03_10584, partial [Trichinella britovi]
LERIRRKRISRPHSAGRYTCNSFSFAVGFAICAFRSRVIQIIFFLFLMADVPDLRLVPNCCGGMSLVYEGRAYKLKRAGRQKYWRCSKDKEGCGGAIWTNLDVTSVIMRNDPIESCQKRSAEETKPIPAIYDEEASAASAEPSTSALLMGKVHDVQPLGNAIPETA